MNRVGFLARWYPAPWTGADTNDTSFFLGKPMAGTYSLRGRSPHLAYAILLLLASPSCWSDSSSTSNERDAPVGTAAQALSGAPDPDSPMASAVVKLTDAANNLRGSGILITPRLVLTAGHVATIAGLKADLSGQTYPVISQVSLSTGQPKEETGRDVGLLRLRGQPNGTIYDTAVNRIVGEVFARRPSFSAVSLDSQSAFS